MSDDHWLASRVGDEVDGCENVCDCCGNIIDREILGICCDTDKLAFLGPGYPLFFNFMKYCCYLLLVMIVTSSAYNMYTNYLGDDCIDISKV